jgi:hypothetical protein
MTNSPVTNASPAVAGALVACWETGAFASRRHVVLGRLRQLRDSESFESLPGDLKARIREIVADSEQRRI